MLVITKAAEEGNGSLAIGFPQEAALEAAFYPRDPSTLLIGDFQ